MATDADHAALASVDSASAAAATAAAAIGSTSSSAKQQRPIDATIAALIISHYEGDRDENGACHGEGHADFRDGYGPLHSSFIGLFPKHGTRLALLAMRFVPTHSTRKNVDFVDPPPMQLVL